MSIGKEMCPGCIYSGHSHLEGCPHGMYFTGPDFPVEVEMDLMVPWNTFGALRKIISVRAYLHTWDTDHGIMGPWTHVSTAEIVLMEQLQRELWEYRRQREEFYVEARYE